MTCVHPCRWFPMKYVPVCVALSLAVLYIVIAVPPSLFSKVACVLLGLALLYCGSCAKASAGSDSFGEESGEVRRAWGECTERFRLIRGDAVLGFVTHTPEERIDGGASWDIGLLETVPEFEVVRHLFEQEQRLLDEVVRLEIEMGANGPTTESTRLMEQAAGLQREIMKPGVRLVNLSDGRQIEVGELHVEGVKVFWR
jgi:hypothetical protein